MPTPEEIARKYALVNAVEHSGKAQAKSVLGRILADMPELRDRVLELRALAEDACDDINRTSPMEQKQQLAALGGVTETRREERKELPDLERKDRFVVRFAPNPDGALHLGNARPAVLCDEYARRYKGKFILRFDDTDPKIKVPEKRFYQWIRDDLKWLGIRWHKEVTASRRLAIYYKHAEALVRMRQAYVCSCTKASWKKLIMQSKGCPCRGAEAATQMNRWKKMLSGYREGEAVLRIKTDLQAKNPAVRDWAAMRIVDKPKHPIARKRVWPLYNFASAIDDYLLGITHIFRGQEHSTNEVKQRFLYQYFGWTYPFVITLGRFSLSGMVLSKSAIREGIEHGTYSDWDELSLGTLRALRRRGFQPEAIRSIINDVGPKPNDITISLENLSAYNRRLIDRSANRYFFVHDPKKIEVRNLRMRSTQIPLHPEAKRGFRKFTLGRYFYIEAKDFAMYKGLEVRLKDLCNIRLAERAEFTSNELKPLPKIHWVPERHLTVRVFTPEREIKGYAELSLAREKTGAVVQFERFGFVRLEKIGSKAITAVFAHE